MRNIFSPTAKIYTTTDSVTTKPSCPSSTSASGSLRGRVSLATEAFFATTQKVGAFFFSRHSAIGIQHSDWVSLKTENICSAMPYITDAEKTTITNLTNFVLDRNHNNTYIEKQENGIRIAYIPEEDTIILEIHNTLIELDSLLSYAYPMSSQLPLLDICKIHIDCVSKVKSLGEALGIPQQEQKWLMPAVAEIYLKQAFWKNEETSIHYDINNLVSIEYEPNTGHAFIIVGNQKIHYKTAQIENITQLSQYLDSAHLGLSHMDIRKIEQIDREIIQNRDDWKKQGIDQKIQEGCYSIFYTASNDSVTIVHSRFCLNYDCWYIAKIPPEIQKTKEEIYECYLLATHKLHICPTSMPQPVALSLFVSLLLEREFLPQCHSIFHGISIYNNPSNDNLSICIENTFIDFDSLFVFDNKQNELSIVQFSDFSQEVLRKTQELESLAHMNTPQEKLFLLTAIQEVLDERENWNLAGKNLTLHIVTGWILYQADPEYATLVLGEKFLDFDTGTLHYNLENRIPMQPFSQLQHYILENQTVLLEIAQNQKQDQYVYADHLPRSLLFTTTGEIYVHLNKKTYTCQSHTKKGDSLLGKGGKKVVTTAYNICSREEFASASMPTESSFAEKMGFYLIAPLGEDVLICKHIAYYESKLGKLKTRFLLEKFEGGDLGSHIRHNQLSMRDKQLVARWLLSVGVKLYNQELLHRDLKPENILCKRLSDGFLQCKLIDYELVCNIHNEEETRRLCGTYHYLSPETCKQILHKQLPKSSSSTGDLWSIALTLCDIFQIDLSLFDLTSYTHPALSKNKKEQIEKYLQERANYKETSTPPERPRSLKYLLWTMLRQDPSQRISVEEALRKFDHIDWNK